MMKVGKRHMLHKSMPPGEMRDRVRKVDWGETAETRGRGRADPRDRAIGIGLVAAVIAGFDGGGEMSRQRQVNGTNLGDGLLDALGHRPARALAVGDKAAVAAAEADCGRELIAERFDLGVQRADATEIMVALGLGQPPRSVTRPPARLSARPESRSPRTVARSSAAVRQHPTMSSAISFSAAKDSTRYWSRSADG